MGTICADIPKALFRETIGHRQRGHNVGDGDPQDFLDSPEFYPDAAMLAGLAAEEAKRAARTAEARVLVGPTQTELNLTAAALAILSNATDIAANAADIITNIADIISLNPIRYDTGEQVITSGGTLGPFTHSLGGLPDGILISFVCQTGEGGWSAGEEIVLPLNQFTAAAADRGCVVQVTSTQLTIVISTASAAFYGYNKATGAVFGMTNGNWKIRLRAFRLGTI
jgi:hypothetical protein